MQAFYLVIIHLVSDAWQSDMLSYTFKTSIEGMELIKITRFPNKGYALRLFEVSVNSQEDIKSVAFPPEFVRFRMSN